MTAWAVAGQSLGLIVGGAGLGMAAAAGVAAWFTFHRAEDLQERLLEATLDHYGTAAELATCQAVRNGLREGAEIDADIPLDLDGFDLRDAWRVRPAERPD